MQEIDVSIYPVDKSRMFDLLSAKAISINEYAKEYLLHNGIGPLALTDQITLTVCSLAELGLHNGAVYEDIALRLKDQGLRACRPYVGLFFRLAYISQSISLDNRIGGTNRSPEGAVIVYSELLENNESFPKGLYLRNIGGNLWLRGYICDNDYVFSGDDLFAFEKII